jgi:hypothetical protein
MYPKAADRPSPLRVGWLVVALGAAAVLVLGGCGQFNDNPVSGVALRYSFDAGGGASTAGTSGRMYTWPPELGEPIETLIIGAVIITFQDSPLTAVGEVTGANQELLMDDAVRSLNYLDMVQLSSLPESDPIASFQIPAANVGNWQLAAVGLRNRRERPEDILDSDAIWYGFIGTFLNQTGGLAPGQLVDTPLVLNPWCAVNGNPFPPSGVCL